MFDKFSERHIGVSNEKELKAMLETIGVKSVDELISQVIPHSIRLKKPLALPAEGMSEYEFAGHIRALAERNRCLRSFIGMGYYPCAVPAAVTRNVFENPAWYTSYTPYQAEISQGRLEALLNFQTAVISLTGMETPQCFQTLCRRLRFSPALSQSVQPSRRLLSLLASHRRLYVPKWKFPVHEAG